MRFVVQIAAPALALCCAAPVLAQESDDGPIDWSVGLRGTYTLNESGSSMGLSLTPEMSMTLEGESSANSVAAGAELLMDAEGNGRIASISGSAQSALRLGPGTLLGGSLSATLSQSSPTASGLPANTAIAPWVLGVSGELSAVQDMGQFDTTLRLKGARGVTTETVLDDSSTIDNSDKSYWQGGGSLRVGYKFTPLITLFGEAEASMQVFDAPDPSLMVLRDARTYTLRGGVSYARGSVLSAEASAGYAWLDYVNDTLTDTPSWVYDASLTFRPDETLSLTASLDTTLGPSANVANDTDVGYTLGANATYVANTQLTLRGSAAWDRTITVGTGDASWELSAGAGFDFRTARNVIWTADYGWARKFTPPGPESDTHSVMVGVRVTR